MKRQIFCNNCGGDVEEHILEDLLEVEILKGDVLCMVCDDERSEEREKLKSYKVIVHVETPYATIVEAESEDEAITLALERDAPSLPAYTEDEIESEWVTEGLMEFPNLGKNEKPDVEEL